MKKIINKILCGGMAVMMLAAVGCGSAAKSVFGPSNYMYEKQSENLVYYKRIK